MSFIFKNIFIEMRNLFNAVVKNERRLVRKEAWRHFISETPVIYKLLELNTFKPWKKTLSFTS